MSKELTSDLLNNYEPKFIALMTGRRLPKRPGKSNITIHQMSNKNAVQCGDSSRIGWAHRMEYSVAQQYEEAKKRIAYQQQTTFARDPNKLLEVLISTIILAARRVELPEEHLIYSLMYLKSIKDEFGDHPPNISNFIKYLNTIKKQQKFVWKKSYQVEPETPMHVYKIQNPKKLSRIPRPIRPNDDNQEQCQSLNKLKEAHKEMQKSVEIFQQAIRTSGGNESTLMKTESYESVAAGSDELDLSRIPKPRKESDEAFKGSRDNILRLVKAESYASAVACSNNDLIASGKDFIDSTLNKVE